MIRTKLSDPDLQLTAKEQKICHSLLANYPTAGLSTIADLAESAGVSVPTVLRFVAKLGFPGFTAFQKCLVEEVSNQLNSPLSLFRDRSARVKGSVYQSTMRTLSSALEQLDTDYCERDFEAIVDLLSAERSQIHCLGGRFSGVVAARLAQHLYQVRPNVHLLDLKPGNMSDLLVDYSDQVTLIVFDFRRYQRETIRYAELAHKRRAKIVLFTDRWQSPISKFANRILISPIESNSPFDSWVPAIAQTEAIVAKIAERNQEKVQTRLATIEALREEFEASD